MIVDEVMKVGGMGSQSMCWNLLLAPTALLHLSGLTVVPGLDKIK
jgi:hypothetical protein